MKFLQENILFIGLALGSGFLLLWPMLQRGASSAKNVSPAEAVLMMNRNNALVLDVREATEFDQGHIADAKHIPLDVLETQLPQLQKYKDKPILVHCQGGVRSAKACAVLAEHEFKQVHNLTGGLNAWVAAKLPTVKA